MDIEVSISVANAGLSSCRVERIELPLQDVSILVLKGFNFNPSGAASSAIFSQKEFRSMRGTPVVTSWTHPKRWVINPCSSSPRPTTSNQSFAG